MSEQKHINDMMKSILDSGQEDVPAHIWEGVSTGLDMAARRRSVVVLFRSIGIAAAAAAVVAGFLLNTGKESDVMPEDTADMVAVVENTQTENIAESVMIADAGKIADIAAEARIQSIPTKAETKTETETVTEMVTVEPPVPYQEESFTRTETQPSSSPVTEPTNLQDESSVWIDEPERNDKKVKASIVLSGIAGTNNPQKGGGPNPMKSPAIGKQYTTTTIEHSGSDATYGIPLSFGAGVKLRFTDRWSLGMGLNYSLLTSRFNGKYIKVNADGTEDLPIIDKISNTQHYIGIPLNVYYDIMNRESVSFYAYAGGAVEKCIGNNYQVLTSPVIHHSEQTKGVQLSVNAGIGVEFMLSRHLGLYIDPSLRYYFNNGQPKSIRTAQPLMLGFEMGLRFNL